LWLRSGDTTNIGTEIRTVRVKVLEDPLSYLPRSTNMASANGACPARAAHAAGDHIAADEGVILTDLKLCVIAMDSGATAILNDVNRRNCENTPGVPGIPWQLSEDIKGHSSDDWSALSLHIRGQKHEYRCTVSKVSPPDGASYSSLVAIQLRRGSSAYHSIAQLAAQCGLTPREEEVLMAISIGLTSREVAWQMKISPNTVKTHLRLIMVKFGVTTRAAIVGRLLNCQSSGEVDTEVAPCRRRWPMNHEDRNAYLASIVESIGDAVLSTNQDGVIVSWNPGATKLFGYSAGEIIGRSVVTLFPPGDAGETSAILERVCRGESVGSFESDQMHKAGHRIPASLTVSPIREPDGCILGACAIARDISDGIKGKRAVAFVSDITQRRLMEQEAENHAKEVAALAAGLLTAQEDERRRISRELHDQICQQLACLAIDIGAFAAAPPSPDTSLRLRALQARVVKVSEGARHLAYELHPSVLDDLGLEASLHELCRDFSDRHGLAIVFTDWASPGKVSRELASCLYRVAQECLQNAAKHAHATHVRVALKARRGALLLTVNDDGDGFDVKTGKGRGGLGLIGMEERARLIGGSLRITTAPGRGTRIALQIPYTT
jgi:PAS domain S-box-containing protein